MQKIQEASSVGNMACSNPSCLFELLASVIDASLKSFVSNLYAQYLIFSVGNLFNPPRHPRYRHHDLWRQQPFGRVEHSAQLWRSHENSRSSQVVQ